MTLGIGLTGGIGSGKTAVANAFATLGVEVCDTDRLAHASTAPGSPGLAAVLAEFGPEVRLPDGSLDRASLRRLVFSNATARARLESILHPLIRDAARRECGAWRGVYGVLVVPLLFERGGFHGLVDRTLVVDCPEEEQVARVARRSALAVDEVRAIMASQLPRADRLRRADDILDNSGPAALIAPQVATLDRRYRQLAAAAAIADNRV